MEYDEQESPSEGANLEICDETELNEGVCLRYMMNWNGHTGGRV